MWPFSLLSAEHITLELASRAASGANLVFIISLVAGVVATFVIVQMTDIKEEHWEAARRKADKEISDAKALSAKLEQEAAADRSRATAMELEIAKAVAEAAKANLELAKFKAPRLLTADQQESMKVKIQGYRGQEYCALLPPAGVDTAILWSSLDAGLRNSGWTRVNPPGLVVGSPPAGVAINAEPGIYIGVAPTRKAEIGPAAAALANALNWVGISAQLGLDTEAEKQPSAIRIVIGLKPQ